MILFRWMKYSYIFEYKVDSFILLLTKRELKKKLFNFFFTVEILYIIKYNVYAFFYIYEN